MIPQWTHVTHEMVQVHNMLPKTTVLVCLAISSSHHVVELRHLSLPSASQICYLKVIMRFHTDDYIRILFKVMHGNVVDLHTKVRASS